MANDGTTNTYTNTELSEMRRNARTALTNRKLNTEFLLIKNQILGANSRGLTSITYGYSYIYDPVIGANDYFIDLLDKIQTMFPESTINYVINYVINVVSDAEPSFLPFDVTLLSSTKNTYSESTRSLNTPNADQKYNTFTNNITIDWIRVTDII
jgi:hypothetical protein